MSPFIYLGAVLVVGVVYMYFMHQNRKSFESNLNMDQEKGKYDEYKRQLLDEEFSFLKQWMHPLPIDAFSNASLPRSASNLYTDAIFKGAKDYLRKNTGNSRIKYPKEYFAVLSGDDLHFFELDEENELKEHLIYNPQRLSNANVTAHNKIKETIGIQTKQGKKYLPKVTEITFNLEDGPKKIEIHDRLNYKIQPLELLNMAKQNEKQIQLKIVGSRLMEKLKEKYPNLKSNFSIATDD